MTIVKNNSKTSKEAASEAASAFGRLGGKATARKYGKAHMRKIAKKGLESRWGKKKN